MSALSQKPIALFDSGVGGLTVLRAISNELPYENILYLGDTARVPYGTRSNETIINYTMNAASRLIEKGVKMLVVACNTATSAALPALQKEFKPLPILGVIEPGADSAVSVTTNGYIAVIGTEATIKGGAYQREINRRLPSAKIIGKPCTLFVPLAEEGWVGGEITEKIIWQYLGDIFAPSTNSETPDTLLLGCTHFPLLIHSIKKLVGQNINIVDSSIATAKVVAKELAQLGLLNSDKISGKKQFLVTDNPERFARTGEIFLGKPLKQSDLELIEL